jgi:hypothetical protein
VLTQSPAVMPLAPEPLDEDEGAEPLRPLPGLGHQEDEPTHINPSEVTEALAALSKDATDPGDPDALDDILTASEDDDEEPTRIDPIIPGITGPLPIHKVSKDQALDGEGPTNVIPPEEAKVLFEGADPLLPIPGDTTGLEHDDATVPNGSQVLPFPSRLPHIGSGEETEETTRPNDPARRPDESTTSKSAYPAHDDDDDDLDDEPTAPTSPEMIKSLRPISGGQATGGQATGGQPNFGAAQGQASNDEEPTVPLNEASEEEEPTAPTMPHGDPVAADGGISDDDEPTVQNRPHPGITLAGVGNNAKAPVLEPRQLARPHGAGLAPSTPQASSVWQTRQR